MATDPPSGATHGFGALILDFDGLVVETEEPEFVAWQSVFQDHGAELTLDEWSAAIGTVDGVDPFALLSGRTTAPVDDTVVLQSYRQRHADGIALTTLQPGVVHLLDGADRLSLPVAIASSSPTRWIERHLERLGIRDRFAAIASFDTVGVAKPAPDVYLRAAELLGVAPSAAVAFEDSRNGLLAAKAAGCTCVVVPTAMTRHLDLSLADLVVESLADRPLDALLAELSPA
jgi:HAD superfamily hydrolase (TIGR01509 family)